MPLCARCNDGWMEKLDYAAEDVFLTHACLGYPVKLGSMADKAVLGRWCALIATLMDQTLRPPTLPNRHHQTLYGGDVPEEMQTWLFRTEPPADRDVIWMSSRHLSLTVRGRRSGVLNTFDYYFATFGIQQLVCHVAVPTGLTPTDSSFLRRPDGFAKVAWPAPLTPLIWPPPETLSWDDAMQLPDQLRREIENTPDQP
jgi:hypothetical protein